MRFCSPGNDSRGFLDIYRRLNRILPSGRIQELTLLRGQNQLKQAIADIAHDIRTPLTSAAGYLQMPEELFFYTKLKGEGFRLECVNTAVYPVLRDKADKARRKGSSGLWLAIVKKLMERMGGRAQVHICGNMLAISLCFAEGE